MTGAEIKAFRRRELLTQEMLAQAIGTLQAYISSWEKESRPIPAEQETKLRQLMGASSQERREMLAEIRKGKAEAERRRKIARQARAKQPEKEPAEPVKPTKPCNHQNLPTHARIASTGSTWTARKAKRCTAPASRRLVTIGLAAWSVHTSGTGRSVRCPWMLPGRRSWE